MPFWIHPEDKDEIKLPFQFPIDKNDYEKRSKIWASTFSDSQSTERIKIKILAILKKKEITFQERQNIWNSLENISIEKDIKNQIYTILNADFEGVEDKKTLRKIIRQIEN